MAIADACVAVYAAHMSLKRPRVRPAMKAVPKTQRLAANHQKDLRWASICFPVKKSYSPVMKTGWNGTGSTPRIMSFLTAGTARCIFSSALTRHPATGKCVRSSAEYSPDTPSGSVRTAVYDISKRATSLQVPAHTRKDQTKRRFPESQLYGMETPSPRSSHFRSGGDGLSFQRRRWRKYRLPLSLIPSTHVLAYYIETLYLLPVHVSQRYDEIHCTYQLCQRE